MGYTVALAYPSEERVALSSLAYFIITGILEEMGLGVRRYYLENREIKISERYRGSPKSNTAILVSLPYELMYGDMVRMLDLMGIPVFRSSRGDQDPIIIAGGPAVTANPLPVFDIVDAILIGEFEPIAESLDYALSKPTRASRLRALSEIEGFLVPGYTEGLVRRVYVEDLDNVWYPIRQEMPENIEPVWGRAFLLETTRGCARGCRFCMEGFIFKPRRDKSFPKLKELLDEGVAVNRVSKVSFYSLIFFDNPAADKILEYSVSKGLEVSVPSLRVETLNSKRAELIAMGKQRTITIAPETGSCVVAKAILKPIGKIRTLEAVHYALEAGIRNIKLYLMTGFPGETWDDVRDTIDLSIDIAKTVRSRGGVVKATLNPLMPKPSTPLQWLGLEGASEVESKLEYISRELRKNNIEVSTFNIDWAILEVAIARGGIETGRVIVEWARRGGGFKSFMKSAETIGVDISLNLRTWSIDYTPPWHEYIEHPYDSIRDLRREYELYSSIMASRGRNIRLNIPGCVK
ncbi:MAG: radical SAM protein [Acidilobaceae archaeon]